jgi:hypothetical protein
MNACLRYGHEFTLTRFILAMTVLSKATAPDVAAWEFAMSSVQSEEVRGQLANYRNWLGVEILRYIILRSFVLYLLILPLKIISKLKEFLRRYCFPKAVAAVEKLESQALEQDYRNTDNRSPVPVGAA